MNYLPPSKRLFAENVCPVVLFEVCCIPINKSAFEFLTVDGDKAFCMKLS